MRAREWEGVLGTVTPLQRDADQPSLPLVPCTSTSRREGQQALARAQPAALRVEIYLRSRGLPPHPHPPLAVDCLPCCALRAARSVMQHRNRSHPWKNKSERESSFFLFFFQSSADALRAIASCLDPSVTSRARGARRGVSSSLRTVALATVAASSPSHGDSSLRTHEGGTGAAGRHRLRLAPTRAGQRAFQRGAEKAWGTTPDSGAQQ